MAAGLVLLLIALLVWRCVQFMLTLREAIAYPFQIDYGEGIVWQQALLMRPGTMYGDITRYPFIVFHYPPLYHLVVRAIAGFGMDYLAAGRAVSAGATLAVAGLLGAITFKGTRATAGRTAALEASAVAGLIIFTFAPVVVWAPLMRVDMLAVAFSFAGIWCGLMAAERPGFAPLAALAFVAAIFTKQTSLAAPIAIVTAASPCQPPTIAPASIESRSPAASLTPASGMPCTIWQLTDVQIVAG